MQGSEVLIRCLEELNVKYIFGYPGGANLPIYDALYSSKKLKHILAYHEQGATLMADGYARIAKEVGVCLVTSGPGVTNMVTGLANAYLDSVPIVALTGQIPMKFVGSDAFQEVDCINITLSVTKHNQLITDANEIAPAIKEAFEIANSGRKGPVLLDFPKDILLTKVSYSPTTKKRVTPGYQPTTKAHIGQIKRCSKKLAKAKKPLVLVGGGVERSDASLLLKKFIEVCKIPCVRTLMGKNSIADEHPLFVGMIGTHGTVEGNKAISKADVILALGTRFGDRSTLMKKERFARQAEIIHVDIDPAEIGKIVKTKIPIVSDIKSFLADMLAEQKKSAWRHGDSWLTKKTQTNILPKSDNAQVVGEILGEIAQIPQKLHLTTDVGRHQLWAVHRCCNPKHLPLLTSGGLGAMGYGLPAAIGAWFAKPQATINIAGDGSFLMNMQEFLVAVRHKMSLVVLIINDSKFAMIRELQESAYRKRYIAHELEIKADFVTLAESMGGAGYRIENFKDVLPTLKKALKSKVPTIIDCNLVKIAGEL